MAAGYSFLLKYMYQFEPDEGDRSPEGSTECIASNPAFNNAKNSRQAFV